MRKPDGTWTKGEFVTTEKQDAAAPSLTESFRQLREITTEETKQRIDEWREQREKYNDEVEFLRAELQAYREALRMGVKWLSAKSMTKGITPFEKELLDTYEALLAKEDKK